MAKSCQRPLPAPGGGGVHAIALLPFELFEVTVHGREHSHTSPRQKRNLALRNPFSSAILPGFLFARPHIGQSCLVAPADPPKHEGVTKKGIYLCLFRGPSWGSPSSLRGLLSSLRPQSYFLIGDLATIVTILLKRRRVCRWTLELQETHICSPGRRTDRLSD